jgi:hypothetical protein
MSYTDFAEIRMKLEPLDGLSKALKWAVADSNAGNVPTPLITQDEYTQDVLFEYGGFFVVVFDTT